MRRKKNFICLVPVTFFLNVRYIVLLSCVAHVYMYCKHIFQCKHVIYRFPSPQSSGFAQSGGICRTKFFQSSLTICWWTISQKKIVCYVNFRPGLVSCSWLPNWLVSRQANTYCRYTLTKFLCWNKYDSSTCPIYSKTSL